MISQACKRVIHIHDGRIVSGPEAVAPEAAATESPEGDAPDEAELGEATA
jgi:hypothetical protein